MGHRRKHRSGKGGLDILMAAGQEVLAVWVSMGSV